MREDMESVSGTRTVLSVAFIVLVVATSAFSAQSTSAQIIYPGIVVEFNCKVTSPFIHVNDHELTTDRGIGGYVADLLDMGIEAKDVNSQFSIIPTVCVNGSSPALSNTTRFTMTCQDIQVVNRQVIIIHHFNFTLTYQSKLPAPGNVSMNNNMLEWSRPPCVTNSSSDTYSIEVNHTLEYTYTIYITRTTDGTTTTITVSTDSTTSYDLSDMLQPCSEHSIEVRACYSNTDCDDNGRSPAITFMYMMPGCPVNPVSEDTVTTIPSPATEREDSTKQTTCTGISPSSMTVIIVAGVVLSVVLSVSGFVCGIVSELVFNHMKTRKKNNNNNNNNMVGAQVSTQPAPVYEEVIEPQCSVEMKENVAYGPINKTK